MHTLLYTPEPAFDIMLRGKGGGVREKKIQFDILEC